MGRKIGSCIGSQTWHVEDQNIKASKEHYTRGMQYIAQMSKPALDRSQSCQNNGLNMLKWELKMLEEHAHMLSYKQGIIHNPQKL